MISIKIWKKDLVMFSGSCFLTHLLWPFIIPSICSFLSTFSIFGFYFWFSSHLFSFTRNIRHHWAALGRNSLVVSCFSPAFLCFVPLIDGKRYMCASLFLSSSFFFSTRLSLLPDLFFASFLETCLSVCLFVHDLTLPR